MVPVQLSSAPAPATGAVGPAHGKPVLHRDVARAMAIRLPSRASLARNRRKPVQAPFGDIVANRKKPAVGVVEEAHVTDSESRRHASISRSPEASISPAAISTGHRPPIRGRSTPQRIAVRVRLLADGLQGRDAGDVSMRQMNQRRGAFQRRAEIRRRSGSRAANSASVFRSGFDPGQVAIRQLQPGRQLLCIALAQ